MTSSLFCDTCGAVLPPQANLCPVCGEAQQSPPLRQFTQTTELKPGFLLMQRYQIREKVGEGGFGVVYKAWDKPGGRIVAIKQITLAALSAQEMIEVTDSYNREITLLPRLQHKNLLEIYDHFTDPEHWYIVMQYIYGQTLEEALGKAPDGRLSVAEVVSIGAQLCDVLGYLHVQEPPIIFRDVKPANVMIERQSGGRIYLIDFGIARRYQEGQTRDTGPLGSPGYAAPEQYGRGQSTPRTDMYGLGATLQTLLTGKEPLEIQTAGMPANCDIPQELQALIAQMMEHDPDNRPAFMWTVGQFFRDLQKRYPLSVQLSGVAAKVPFAWLATLWTLCMLAVTPLFFSNAIHLLALALAVGVVVGMTIYHFDKATGSVFSKQIHKKDVRRLVKEALAGSLYWVWLCFAWGCAIPIGVILKFFDLKTFLTLIIYLVVSITGMLLITKQWLPFLKQMKQTQTPAQSQQVAQAPLMQQQTRKRS